MVHTELTADERLTAIGLFAEAFLGPSDRRSSYAVITAGGRKRMDEVLPGHLALIDEWFTGQLDPEQLDALLTALRKVRDAVRPYAAVGGVPPVCAARPLSSGG